MRSTARQLVAHDTRYGAQGSRCRPRGRTRGCRPGPGSADPSVCSPRPGRRSSAPDPVVAVDPLDDVGPPVVGDEPVVAVDEPVVAVDVPAGGVVVPTRRCPMSSCWRCRRRRRTRRRSGRAWRRRARQAPSIDDVCVALFPPCSDGRRGPSAQGRPPPQPPRAAMAPPAHLIASSLVASSLVRDGPVVCCGLTPSRSVRLASPDGRSRQRDVDVLDTCAGHRRCPIHALADLPGGTS